MSEKLYGAHEIPEHLREYFEPVAEGEHGVPLRNIHKTVKSVGLMRYLVRMITPPGGVVLDMFAGSGTTAMACEAEGFDYILIERDERFVPIAQARAAYAERKQAEKKKEGAA